MRPYRGVDASAFASADPKLRDALIEINRALMEVSQELSSNRTGSTGAQGQQAVVTSGFNTDNAILTSDGTSRTAQSSSATVNDDGDITCTDISFAAHSGSTLGFYGATAVAKQEITGSPVDNVLDDLLAALGTLGLITDSTS